MGEDGVVCVVREEERDKLEQEQEQQCTQQNVTQCYNEYSTVYRDVVREKCTEVYLKTCRIVIRERTYNHTARVCKRPLVKLCDPHAHALGSQRSFPAKQTADKRIT